MASWGHVSSKFRNKHDGQAKWVPKKKQVNVATEPINCEIGYKNMDNGLHLLCVTKQIVEKIMDNVHAGVYGTHMNGRMFVQKFLTEILLDNNGKRLLLLCEEMRKMSIIR